MLHNYVRPCHINLLQSSYYFMSKSRAYFFINWDLHPLISLSKNITRRERFVYF